MQEVFLGWQGPALQGTGEGEVGVKTKVQIFAWECVCENPECPSKGQPWIFPYDYPPTACRYCRSREWDGKKPLRGRPKRPEALELPRPVRVRPADRNAEEF